MFLKILPTAILRHKLFLVLKCQAHDNKSKRNVAGNASSKDANDFRTCDKRYENLWGQDNRGFKSPMQW